MEEQKDVLVKFYASWCPHCREIKEEWEKLAQYFNERPEAGVVIS